MIYFIHGPDRLLARESVLEIVADLDPEGANTSWLDGRETSIERVAASIGAVTFFGAPRIVIVSDLLARASREAESDADESRRPRGLPGLEALIRAVPEQNVLILFEPTLASVPASMKSAAPAATIVAGEPPRGSALLAWIERAAADSNSRIDRRAAQRLAESLFPQTWDRKPNNPRYDRPPDMAVFTQEIAKLALAAHPGPITIEDIAALTPGGPDQRVFRFIDAALGGDIRTALDELERLAEAGEEPAMLLSQVLGQVELATVASAAGGRSADTVARDLGTIAPGRMSAVMTSTRRHAPRADRAVAIGAATDRKLKTGRIRKPDDALRDLILALATGTSERPNGHSE